MAYSKSYQTVIAGRVREDEAIGMLKDNKVATPVKTTNFQNQGGKKQPTLDTDHLQHVGIGKKGSVSENISAYNPNKYNTSA